MGSPSYVPLPITVVIPAFNRSELLTEALQSVQRQTVPPAEVIVVDDGSTDERVGAVARDHGAHLIRQSNAGLPNARNVGIAAATSPWIALLDSDDLWLPGKLEQQWEAACAVEGVGMVLCDFRLLTEYGTFDETGFELAPEYLAIPKIRLGRSVVELQQPHAGQALARKQFAQPSGMLLRRDIVQRVGGFDESLGSCEDHEFALRMTAAARVTVVENALIRYRIHSQNMSRNEVKMRLHSLRIYEMVCGRPAQYPAGAVEAMKSVYPTLLRKAAAAYLKRGDMVNGRAYLGRALSARFTARDAALWLATWLAPARLSEAHAATLAALYRRRPWKRARDWEAASEASVAMLTAAHSSTPEPSQL